MPTREERALAFVEKFLIECRECNPALDFDNQVSGADVVDIVTELYREAALINPEKAKTLTEEAYKQYNNGTW